MSRDYKQAYYNEINQRFEDKIAGYPLFIKEYFSLFKSALTKKSYLSYLNHMWKWFIDMKILQKDSVEDLRPEDFESIKPLHMTNYLNYLKKTQSTQTIKLKKNVFSSFFGYLLDNEWVTKNVMKATVIRKNRNFMPETSIQHNSVKMPNDKDMKIVFQHIQRIQTPKELRDATIIRLLYECGLRRGELIALDVSDINIEERKISVISKGKLEVQDDVPIPEDLVVLLQTYLDMREKITVETNALFLSNRRGRLKETALHYLCKQVSGGTITPHMFRHWCGTKQYEEDKDIARVRKVLRHSDVTTTAKYYIH